MKMKFRGISRIVENAETLSNPTIAECFFYGCEDSEGLASVLDEIDELRVSLPDGIAIRDLPHTYCGNKKTKVFGLGICDATQGHQITIEDALNRIVFDEYDDAIKMGYRPCKRCMPDDYLDWLEKKQATEEV